MCPWPAPACPLYPGKGLRDCQLRWGWRGTGEEQRTPSGLVGAASRVQLFPADERALIDLAWEGGLTPKSKPLPGSPVRSCPELQWAGGRSLKRKASAATVDHTERTRLGVVLG